MGKRRSGRPGIRRAGGHQEGLVPTGGRGLSTSQKRDLMHQVRALAGPARSFVAEMFRRAREARGRLDDDVYGIVQATLEALAQNRGVPPPLVFGVTHFETGRVEHVRFLPTGVARIPAGARGRLISNHPGFIPARQDGLPPGRGGNRRRLEG
jgi:hypothetical protein